MSHNPNKKLVIWLFVVCFFIIFLVVFGGWVRLTRSGLSMVDWHVITGVLPPTNQAEWQATFEQYQLSPEFMKIHRSMNLEEYKFIYYNEYIHRMIARFTGLLFVAPLFYYLFTNKITWRKSGVYLAVGLGFAFQGVLGWYMVSSGLVDRPSVSHYRLTAHLDTALMLLGLTFWAALNNIHGTAKPTDRRQRKKLQWMAIFLFFVLMLQISYGGLVAGLKAGHVSPTWPLMSGRLVPPNMLTLFERRWENFLAAPVAVHFVHRWFAFAVLIVAGALYYLVKNRGLPRQISKGAVAMIVITLMQITFGVSVVWFQVPLWLALVHQGTAIMLFLTTVFLNHRLWYR